MARIHLKMVIPHIALGLASILLVVGLFVLVSVEQKKTRDIVRMQEVLSMRTLLQRYYIDHAAYPPSPAGTIQLGVDDHRSLCDAGFVAQNNASCAKKTYSSSLSSGSHLQPDDSYTYTPLADNAVDPCISSAGCPHFAIHFIQETDVLYTKGPHVLTDQGVR